MDKSKHEELMNKYELLIEETMDMKEEMNKLKEACRDHLIGEEKKTRRNAEEESSPDYLKRLDKDLKPNFELGDDAKKFDEWRRKMMGHVGSGDKRLVDYLKWAENEQTNDP